MRRLIFVLAITIAICVVLVGTLTYVAINIPLVWLRPYLPYAWVFVLSLVFVWGVVVGMHYYSEHVASRLERDASRPPKSPTWYNYRKLYLDHMLYRHRDFDMKGLATQGIYNLEQEKVFVKLSLEPQTAAQVSSALIAPIPEKLREGEHSIWDYLRHYQSDNCRFAVIGSPGSGKTTLLRHVTLTFASGKHRQLHPRLAGRIPILLFLRDYIEQIKKNPELNLIELVCDTLKVWKLVPPQGWFEAELQKHRCVVMFDGLDEVADPQLRKRVADWVERQMMIYPKNWFIITSRPGGYRSNPLRGVHLLGVCPFTYKQVQEFVENWYQAIERRSSEKPDRGVHMKAKEGADDLLRRLVNTPALTHLATNPLLLTMIATIHRYRSTLPGRRVDLYSEICDVALGKRRQAYDLDLELAPLQKQRVLQPLAYQMMKHQQQVIQYEEVLQWIREPLARINQHMAGEDFLKRIEESSGLLQERESGVYSFAHKTFQEYLAATYIQEHQLEQVLIAHVEDPWWHETIRLYAARTDASALIEACMRDNPPSVSALSLARDCLQEAAAIHLHVRIRMEQFFRDDAQGVDLQRRRIAAEALLASRLQRMARLNDQLQIDTTLISHNEYQLFLDEHHTQGHYHQPDHWPTLQFPIGQGDLAVVGVRRADAESFCAWLTERDAEWRYRLPKKGEGDIYVKPAMDTFGYWIGDEQHFVGATDLEGARLAMLRRIDQDVGNLQVLVLGHIFIDVSARAQALLSNAGHERDLVAYCRHASALLRDLELAQHLATDCLFARGHDLPALFSAACEHAGAALSAYARAYQFAQESAQASEQALRLSKSAACDSAYGDALTHTRALTNELIVGRVRVAELKHALMGELASNEVLLAMLTNHLDLTSSIIRDLIQLLANAHDFARAFVQRTLRAHIYTPDFEQIRHLAENGKFVLDPGRALECARAFERSPEDLRRRWAAYALARTYLRYWALMNGMLAEDRAVQEIQVGQHRQRLRPLAMRKPGSTTPVDLICYGIYTDLVLLEERLAGNLPAVEGIRIVKMLKMQH